jgi:hypothetical protein
MKSFKTILNEGRGDDKLLHVIIKGVIKKEWSLTKRDVVYYDPDVSNNKDAGKFDLYGVVKIYVVENDMGDFGYDYEAI